ncbi:GUN4 domain-containing protein, partial [Microcoleus sp. CAWBG640]|uniref:GUN4 domain-containing protein n=1 Tax=Microcoleus sp. CAWBG640 TaxID=2841653 RepID=UPI00312B7B5B
MSKCPVCDTEYVEETAVFCSTCGWDLTPYPLRYKPTKIYLKKEAIRLEWAKKMWEFACTQQSWETRFDALQGELQQNAIARSHTQSQLDWVLYRLEQLNPEAISSTLLRLEEKIGQMPEQTPRLSEVGMDYRPLTKLLKTGKWQKADEHTWEILLSISLREEEGWLSAADIDNFPCTDL